MDGETLREAVEAEKRTQLDRLGSDKLLIALTDADLDVASVLSVAALSEHAAAETFRGWAADESDDAAREAFGEVAAQEEAHFERVAEHLDAFEAPEHPGPMHAYLRGLDGTAERVGAGLVGRPLVSARTHTQVISFFINEPDEALAGLFRDLKAETEDELALGVDLLGAVCASDEDWESARAAAEYVVQVAYDDYADSLEGMGLSPKSIC